MAKAKIEFPCIMVIETFLENWRKAAFLHYTQLQGEFIAIRRAEYEVTADNLKRIMKNSWTPERRYSDEKVEAIMNDLEANPHWPAGFNRRNLGVEIQNAAVWEFKHKIGKSETAIVERMWEDGFLDKLLDKEVEAKRAKFFTTVEKKAGKVVDASGLYAGVDGSINGTVQGEIKTVNVQTIYAGGYNIQCLHYRVFVK